MDEKYRSRLNIISNHIVPSDSPSSEKVSTTPSINQAPTFARSSSPNQRSSSSYASATGQSSSYARVHGEVSADPVRWRSIPTIYKEKLQEVNYYKSIGEGIAKIAINRPEKRNAFTPRTIHELSLCFSDARDDSSIGAIILTGEGSLAFCSGGDQSVRGVGGYVGGDGIPRLNVLDLQMQIRRLPKPVIAMVAGYAVGGGHILHMICDLTVRIHVYDNTKPPCCGCTNVYFKFTTGYIFI